jgi:hypothetical protein
MRLLDIESRPKTAQASAQQKFSQLGMVAMSEWITRQ